ncbi:uncharacterized protein LOC101891372 [Musca domestica]|uniref:Uncharacterized protein LOC101891372 n=1 Tax=Musca domestica TaxID=7370 RepID=A0A9J7I890_MUSDO|nr:uncharacterized protein LOC101891372 [Musca domestica]
MVYKSKMQVIIVLSIVAMTFGGEMGYDYQSLHTSTSAGGNHMISNNAGISSNSFHSSSPHTEFYTFSAPEEEFYDANEIQRIAGSVKPKLRVVFIRTPENKALENAALDLAKQAAQQKTAVYVLNKQTDIGELAHKFNAIQKGSATRPEVHFVKYRTAEEAIHAQHTIQSQYDSFAGQSRNINGGVAGVLNFATQSSAVVSHIPSQNNEYLPSMVLRL